jgi:hypothetical protein
MVHRKAMVAEQQEKCLAMISESERFNCYAKIESCPVVRDADAVMREDGEAEPMAPQCKRSCSKAKCECCQT